MTHGFTLVGPDALRNVDVYDTERPPPHYHVDNHGHLILAALTERDRAVLGALLLGLTADHVHVALDALADLREGVKRRQYDDGGALDPKTTYAGYHRLRVEVTTALTGTLDHL